MIYYIVERMNNTIMFKYKIFLDYLVNLKKT